MLTIFQLRIFRKEKKRKAIEFAIHYVDVYNSIIRNDSIILRIPVFP